ncbi:MAG: hypothetical protein H6Q01_1158, partial [Acidobacteria bacterium]|nr:hypothetical protein [Acidobacteriota bacterium]
MTLFPGRDRAGSWRAVAPRALGVALLMATSGIVASSPASPPDPDPRVAWLQRVEAVRAAWRDPSAPLPSLAMSGAPLDPSAIAREWARMVERSRDPARLAALAEALDFDRLALVETLARPALVERRLRTWWQGQDAASRAARDEVAALQAALETGDVDPRAPHHRREAVLYVPSTCPAALLHRDDAQSIDDPARWNALRARWADLGRPGPVVADGGGVLIEVRLAGHDCGAVEVARYAVPTVPFPAWWAQAAATFDATPSLPVLTREALADLPLPSPRAPLGGDPPTGCDEAWNGASLDDVPDPREGPTAVWTGAEMIVWGGRAGEPLATGGRYDPATDTWRALPQSGAPTPRSWHTAVWTGSRVLVWGGIDGDPLDSGAAYDPASDAWSALPSAGAPAARSRHVAVWTGSEMLVWGGEGPDFTNLGDGGRYDPVGGVWLPLPTAGAPSPRKDLAAVWSGSELLVWGGFDLGAYLGDGAALNLSTGGWRPLSGLDAPAPRRQHTAVWTGSEMVVWGGANGTSYFFSGGRYDPATDSWRPTNEGNPPAGRRYHTAVGTGSRMLVWGGEASSAGELLATGAAYDPLGDTWSDLPTTGAPSARRFHAAVFTGSEMLVWG